MNSYCRDHANVREQSTVGKYEGCRLHLDHRDILAVRPKG